MDTWQLGHGGSGLGAYIARLPPPAAPGQAPALPSDALLLQLPPGASASDVEDAVAAAVGQLLPALGWALVGTLVVHLVFYKLLRVPLPWGVLPPWY